MKYFLLLEKNSLYFYKMATKNMLRKCAGKQDFPEINNKFATVFNKCLKQINYTYLYTC